MHRSTPALLAQGVVAIASLAACGGGGGSGDQVSSGVNLTGLAASGAAIANGAVSIKCAVGSATTTTAADGAFSASLPAQSAGPCIVQVTQGGTALHSIAMGSGRVNVTPVTDLLVTRAAGRDPATEFAAFDASRAAAIPASLDQARSYVQSEVPALAGALLEGDPLTKPFSVGDADDRLLDNLGAVLDQAGRTLADLRTPAAQGSNLRAALPPEESCPHDSIPYVIDPADALDTSFDPMPAAAGDTVNMGSTSRWAGVLEGAAYRIEVPANWNGELVMYAHGYAGEGPLLEPVDSAIRRWLVQHGYAWASSSYSKNSYDVRAGIEDTNLLALNFNRIAAERGRPLPAPTRTYIIGQSMGGHIAAAAVEAETYATARNKVRYDGAMPMCGVVGDTALFDTFAAMQAAAHVLGGHASVPLDQWLLIRNDVTAALFVDTLDSPPVQPNGAAGLAYRSVLQNLTGGPRPLFELGYAVGGSFRDGAHGFFGITTETLGITNEPTGDTRAIVYRVDGDEALSAQLNATAPRATASEDTNRLRRDGLRWIPKVNGQLMAPVMSIHTLGDLFVPFNLQQVYRQRAQANGAGARLVQRAMRGAAHCDFTNAEMARSFSDLVAWVKQGSRPAGDDVLAASTVANPRYGCAFTDDTLDADDRPSTQALRAVIAQQGRSCAALPN